MASLGLNASNVDSRATTPVVTRLSPFIRELLLDFLGNIQPRHFEDEEYVLQNRDRIEAELSAGVSALAASTMIGAIIWTAGTIPDGCLLCDGGEYDRDDYPVLYEAISSVYHRPGNKFVVPDLLNRFALGALLPGEEGGESSHALSVNEMPAHSHSYETFIGGAVTPGELPVPVPVLEPLPFPAVTGTAGLGLAHNNMPPYHTLLPCIIAY